MFRDNPGSESVVRRAAFEYRSRLAQVMLGLALGAGFVTACGSDGGSGTGPSSSAGEATAGAGDHRATAQGGEGGTRPGRGPSSSGAQAGAPDSSDAGGDGGGGGDVPPAPDAPGSVSNDIGASGGQIELVTGEGESTGTIKVPAGALGETTTVTVDPATLPDSAPGTVETVTPGFSIDFDGATLTVPAEAKIKLPYDPSEGDLLILVVTDDGTGFVTYRLEKVGNVTYAVFSVSSGGRYLPVRLKKQPGCDETLASTVSVRKQADLAMLAKVRRIVGSLQITGSDVTSLESLRCLQQLDGALSIQQTGVASLDGLENLTFIGTNQSSYSELVQISSNSLLESVDLPSLLALGTLINNSYYSQLLVANNAILASFSADALEWVNLNFSHNGAASTGTTLSLAALRRAGTLSIQQNPALSDLDGLSALEGVRGDVSITNNGLTNLDGLGKLTTAGGVAIQGNVALTSAEGLSKLKKVASITIANNQLLKAVDLAALETVDNGIYSSSISVTQNAALTAFKADALTKLPGALTFQTNGNASVSTELSFAKLTSINGATTISNNLGLKSLDGFGKLSAAQTLYIAGNAALESISLPALKSVGALTVSSNAKLSELNGLTQLARIDGGLSVSQNTLLTSVALPALATLGGEVQVTSNAALKTFSVDALKVAPSHVTLQNNGAAGTGTKLSFAALTSVAGQLYIYSNPGVTALDGFGALASVGSTLTIQSNAALTSVSSLSKLSTITGGLSIQQNAVLTSLGGLGGLTRITQNLSVSNNALLADITLPALTSVGAVTISNNAALATVAMNQLTASSGALSVGSNGSAAAVTTTTLSFAALTTVAGFQITSNPKLKLLNGFPVLSGVSGNFQVSSNALLPNCSIVSLRNQIQQNGAISGSVSISNNLTDGCALN